MKLTKPQFDIMRSLVETGDPRAHNPHSKGFGATWLTLCRKGLIAGGKPTQEGIAALNEGGTLKPSLSRPVGSFGRTSELSGLTKAERGLRIDLGLAIARVHARPGEPMPLAMLAEFCGRTDGTILMYEQSALRKLRKRVGPELREFFKR